MQLNSKTISFGYVRIATISFYRHTITSHMRIILPRAPIQDRRSFSFTCTQSEHFDDDDKITRMPYFMACRCFNRLLLVIYAEWTWILDQSTFSLFLFSDTFRDRRRDHRDGKDTFLLKKRKEGKMTSRVFSSTNNFKDSDYNLMLFIMNLKRMHVLLVWESKQKQFFRLGLSGKLFWFTVRRNSNLN